MSEMYTPEEAQLKQKEIPRHLLLSVYDADDNVLMGSRYVKGKVAYNYLPAAFMATNRPYIIFVSIAYDGKGNSDLPKEAMIMPYKELPTMFPDNIFG